MSYLNNVINTVVIDTVVNNCYFDVLLAILCFDFDVPVLL